MEEKNETKTTLKKWIILSLVIIILIVAVILVIIFNGSNENSAENNTVENATETNEEIEENVYADYEAVEINGYTYYQRLTMRTWDGEYIQNTYLTTVKNNIQEVVSYDDYIKYAEEINASAESGFSTYYDDSGSNYIILSYATGYSDCTMELIDCIEEEYQIIIYGDESSVGGMGDGYFIAIPTSMPVGTEIIYRECLSDSEIYEIEDQIWAEEDKPIIYLYPTEETEAIVKLGNPENITVSYPKYTTGWNVLAKSDGTLTDLTTGKNLYSLYYESINTYEFEVTDEGFVVKGEDVAEFLEEKLSILGLTDREAEEFIIYWLPILQENEYNYIRFATSEEIEENMPLEIDPNPDTIIRVLMTYKGLDEPVEVDEQNLITPERTGFVAVEWGGTEIK